MTAAPSGPADAAGPAVDAARPDAGAARSDHDQADEAERVLASRIIDTLLREGYGGLDSRVHQNGDDTTLILPGAPDGLSADRDDTGPGPCRRDGTARPGPAAGQDRPAHSLLLEPDGFLTDFRLLRTADGEPAVPLTLDDVDALIAAIGDPRDQVGAAAFAAECRQALAASRLSQQHQPAAQVRIARAWQDRPDGRFGPRGQLGYEALAASLPHPAYPTSGARLGFSDDDALRYAPEFYPQFRLNWLAVPRDRLIVAGPPAALPGWPTMSDVGLPAALAATHDLLPVHPATARDKIAEALAETGLTGRPGSPVRMGELAEPGGPGKPGKAGAPGAAVLAPGTALPVIPTLSTRTVAVVGDPASHLKLPLPTSTLGLLNRRFIKPGTLADGALVQRVLARVQHDDPLLRGLLLADESSYAHVGHHFLGYLLRRLPPGLDRHRIVPLAALLASDPAVGRETDGGTAGRTALVIEELADWAWDSDLAGLFAAYLRQLFHVHVRLFAKYGIALESHQQNAALVLGGPASVPPPAPHRSQQRAPRPGDGTPDPANRCRLLIKDFDGALIHLPRLKVALGADIPTESAFADPRLLTTSDDALADVFITITVHLCAGALAFGLADRGVAPLPDLLALVRRELTAALDRHAAWPATRLLRARVLGADRLPGKSMVTAGTLVAKSRTGASDINKFYGTNGPNYLKDVPMRNCR